MNRILNLQTIAAADETDVVAAGSSCSYVACGGCSTTSALSCGSDEIIKAI